MTVRYSQDFKNNAVEKLLGPNQQSVRKVAANLGVAVPTLYDWKKNYVNLSGMKNNKKINTWSREQKLDVLIKTATMTEIELGIYLRENGLHSSDLKIIRDELLMGPKESKKPSVDPELVKLRRDMDKQSKELHRKDRALAEMAARVVLLKKSHEIWGTPEEDE
jgi:transposase-like protein